MGNWYNSIGPEADIVISSRVRLARNLKNYSFPARLDNEKAFAVIDAVNNAVLNNNEFMDYKFLYYDIESMKETDRNLLVGKHLISPDLLEKKNKKGVILNAAENISMMINEEDHLRIQCILPGMQLEEALAECKKTDALLEERIEFAFNNQFGYITSCPTNLGTGLRASVMLHLPVLTMTGHINRILEACSKLGIAVRGLYGENTEASGNIFQISNQVTLGHNEDEITANVKNIVIQVINKERSLREELYRQNPRKLEDRIFRAYGLFTNARIMSLKECYKLVSNVRLGINLGIIKDVDMKSLNEIMLIVQPAYLLKTIGETGNMVEMDILRADLIRGRMNK